MTRDEAIQVLQTALTSPFIYGEYADAIDMAIEALTQGSRKVTQESTQDLISRQDAISAIEAEIRCADREEDVSGLTLAESMIDLLPSAEPKTGEWIPVSDIRKLEAVVYMHIDSLEGTRNIVEAGMLSAWKEVAEYVGGMLGEDGEA